MRGEPLAWLILGKGFAAAIDTIYETRGEASSGKARQATGLVRPCLSLEGASWCNTWAHSPIIEDYGDGCDFEWAR